MPHRNPWRLVTLYLPLAGFLAFTLFPIYWTLATSLQSETAVARLPIHLIPRELTLENYRALWNFTRFDRFFLNSLLVAGATTLLTLGITTLSGYALSRFRFKGKTLDLLLDPRHPDDPPGHDRHPALRDLHRSGAGPLTAGAGRDLYHVHDHLLHPAHEGVHGRHPDGDRRDGDDRWLLRDSGRSSGSSCQRSSRGWWPRESSPLSMPLERTDLRRNVPQLRGGR